MARYLWFFTRNFTGNAPTLSFGKETQYACWQHERANHDHLQGVIQLKKKSRMNAVKKLIGGNPHLEPVRGTLEQARDYCSKEDTRVSGPYEFGELIKERSNKRKLMEEYLEDPEGMELADPGKARRCRVNVKLKEYVEKFSYSPDQPWQIELSKLLEEEPDYRTIHWVYGPNGNEGKSAYAKSLIQKGWFYTRGGKNNDVSYNYCKDSSRNVVFDIPRVTEDFLNYNLIEMFKDRIIESNKYEPITDCNLNCIHVVVMCNFLPKEGKMSEDRINIIYC